MNRQISVLYDRKILKSAVLHFWLRFINWHGFLAAGLLVLVSLYFLFTGDRSWLLGVSGSFAVLWVLCILVGYYVYLGRSLGRFARMRSKSVEITLTDETFATSSDLGSGAVAWDRINSVWRFSDVWLLFLEQNVFVTMPAKQLDDEVKAFIVEKVKGHGGKIV